MQYVAKAISDTIKILGPIMDANAEAGQYKADAGVHKANATILADQARQVGAEGARREESARRAYSQVAGEQSAAFSESGLGTDGSALDFIRDSETQANLDALNIRYDAQSEARSLRYGSRVARMQSSVARQMARRAKLAGYVGAIGAMAEIGSGGGGGGGGGGLASIFSKFGGGGK